MSALRVCNACDREVQDDNTCGCPDPGTLMAAIPVDLREAIWAAVDLVRLDDKARVRLFWRGSALRRVEVSGLCDPAQMNTLDSDVLDVAVTLHNAGFDPLAASDACPSFDGPITDLTTWAWEAA